MLELKSLLTNEDIGQETYDDTLETFQESLEEKASGYAYLLRSMKAEAEALKDEEDYLKDKRKRIENGMESLRLRILQAMQVLEMQKLKAGVFEFSLLTNGSPTPIVDMELLPEEYMTFVEPKPNLAKIKEAMKNDHVPGCQPGTPTVSLKLK